MEKKQEKYDKEYAKNMMRRYMPLTAVVIVAAVGIIIFYFCVKRYAGLKAGLDTIGVAFTPILMGFVMAFLMNPIMTFLEHRMLPFFQRKSKHPQKTQKTVRLITSLIAMVVLWGIIILFFSVVVPQLYSTILYLSEHIVEQIYGVLDWANEITGGRYKEAILGAKNDEKIISGINTWI